MSRRRRNERTAEYFRRATNYAADAAPELISLMEKTGGVTRAIIAQIVRVLYRGKRFILPDYGSLFDETTKSMPGAFHLPYPEVVIEFDAPAGKDAPGIVAVPRRAVACWEHEGEGAVIWPVNYSRGNWLPNWVGALVPYHQKTEEVGKDVITAAEKLIDKARADPMLAAVIEERGVKAGAFPIDATFLPLSAGLADKLENAMLTAQLDTNDEVRAAIQLCAALECKNVTTEHVVPTREAMQARAGKLTFDYHVLIVNAREEVTRKVAGEGHHASPRTHLRRGHIRHLDSGNVWVNACVVSAGRGFVAKSYAVDSASHAAKRKAGE